MNRCLRYVVIVAALCVVVPAAAHAQGTIAGAVKDTSGALLPGVTVEATSPALIERTRAVVTNSAGLYRIETLPPGTYSVTFTLPGFGSVKREGIEISGTFNATIDADLRVGEVSETITVTGQAPMVDVQSSTQQRVLDRQVLENIPSGRTTQTLGALIPGMTTASSSGVQSQDIGGNTVSMTVGLRLHGGRATDQIFLRNGTLVTASATSGFVSRTQLNMVAQQELVLDTGGVGAEYATGGVRVNIVNREGSNQFHGALYASYGNGSLQGSNFSQALKDKGLRTPDSIKRNYDVNPGFGGAILKDKVWFFGAALIKSTANYAADSFVNKNANNPNLWTYVPDLAQPGYNEASSKGVESRVTYQATRRQKFGVTFSRQANCECPSTVSALRQPEAGYRGEQTPQSLLVTDYTFPISNRLLLEAGVSRNYGASNQLPPTDLNSQMISVLEQQGNNRYRAFPNYRTGFNSTWHLRNAVSYVTGSHALKAGANLDMGRNVQGQFTVQPVEYRFNNGVPNRLTMRALNLVDSRGTWGGAFAQDVWTHDRLTLRYGLRFDIFTGWYPDIVLGPTPLTPNRNVTIPGRKDIVALKDLSPRFGGAYDLFGSQRTAVKFSLGRYLDQLAPGHPLLWESQNPGLAVVTSTTRSWADRNTNFVPDCDLLNPAANGECGVLADPNFGNARQTTAIDRKLTHGWGNRQYNWEFSTGIQQQLGRAAAIDVSYFRKSYSNFLVTDNRALSPQDFDSFSITAPRDPRLPGGGGYVVSGLDVKPDKFNVPADILISPAGNFGKQYERWQGMDVALNLRPGGGVFLQGGVSTGRTVSDNCEVVAKVPEALVNAEVFGFLAAGVTQPQGYCHIKTPFLTQVKLVGSYVIPKVDIQLGAAFQDVPGDVQYAEYVVTSAAIAPSLGRPLAGGTANQTINLVQPGSMYNERLHQLDLRVGKIFRFGRTRTNVGIDIFNALNTDTVMGTQRAFDASWLRPTSILLARFAKISAQIDF